VSSSLGYNIFTSQPSASYTYDDMDGKTSAIARAATKAASVFNMVVVTSAGNEGNGSWKYINTPADADSILAVGSLTSSGTKAPSSSFGPTADGRIKPDVSARGQCVFTARSDSQTSKYTSCISGTSFAAPHVAGMVALALQARPGMPAIWYVRQAHKASSLYSNPNNEIGYGKIDALDLITGVTTSIQEDVVPNLPEDAFVVQNFPNPFNPSTTLYFDVPTGWNLSGVTVIDVTGRSVATIPTATSTSSGTLQWNGYNTAGIRVASGIYFAQFEFKNGAASKILVHPMSLIK
jgi:subtilisin family serine protease